MGRPRVLKTAKQMKQAWEEYKKVCDNHTITVSEYDKHLKRWEERVIRRPVTYSIEGFCLFLGITRQAFYKTYADNEEFVDIATRAREECEVDQRQKFEVGLLDPKLAGLWMGRWGYAANKPAQEQQETVVIEGDVPD